MPTRVPDDNAGYKLEPPYEMEHLDRKIPIPDDLTSYPPFQVKKSNIDSYNHVNNGQYIKMAEEFLPDDFIYTKMRVEYKKQALLDDIILPRVNTEDNKYCIVLDSVEGNPFNCRIRIERNNMIELGKYQTLEVIKNRLWILSI